MPQRPAWRALIPGLTALAAMIGLVLSVLLFARVGAVRGDSYRLLVATSGARGVIAGSDVWLNGQKVGRVHDIRFRSAGTDTSGRVLLELDVLARVRGQIRANSVAQIRTGGSLLGAQVIYITSGTHAAPVLAAGDTIPSRPQGDTEGVTSQFALASRDFPRIIENVKLINAGLHSARGTFGAMGDEGLLPFESLRDNTARLGRAALDGDGSVGRLLSRQSRLAARARHALATADSLHRLLLEDRGTSLGRLRRDTTIVRTLAGVRNELSILRAQLARADGTAGRILHDRALFEEVARVEVELGRLMDDLRRHPARYIAF